jgi:hypothetical protein
MPRLGSYLICEKIIIDQQQKPSIISVFQSLSALIPEGQTIAKDTVGFNPWAIFCEWFFDDKETANGKVEQVVEVLHPDGTPSPIKGRLQFQQFAKDGQGTRSYINLMGLPISQPGFLSINVWMEIDSKRVTDIFPYLIKIEHTTTPPTPNDGGQMFPAAIPQKPQAKPS